jgi:uncharacterized protein YhaN
MLDGMTVDELHRAAQHAREHAQQAAELAERRTARASDSVVQLSSTVDIALDESTVDDEHGAEQLRREYHDAQRLADQASHDLRAMEYTRPSVTEAEEQLAAAQAGLARLRDLDEVLSVTRQYLERARERAHRDVAPLLAATVRRDLATVTRGRYSNAVVDPGTLRIQVQGAGTPLRDADDLSLGTAEQVYLLARVALAEHLVRPGESCPLVLDDVTVHADRDRTDQILTVLRTVARRHQVVLFSSQEQVRDWARMNLDGDRDVLRELTTVAPV